MYGGYLTPMTEESEMTLERHLDGLIAEGWIEDIHSRLRSGKEGTVYCCTGGARAKAAGHDYLIAKVYRDFEHRTFRNDAVYRESTGRGGSFGRFGGKPDRRMQKAVQKKSRAGREGQSASWVNHEYQTLQALYEAGVEVPRPFALDGQAIAMEYIGIPGAPAPQLQAISLEPTESRRLFDDVLRNIRRMLAAGRIHGDLSPYNILYWEGRIVIIDLPQTLDVETHPQALRLLERDVDHVCRYFQRQGVTCDPTAISLDLWWRYHQLAL